MRACVRFALALKEASNSENCSPSWAVKVTLRIGLDANGWSLWVMLGGPDKPFCSPAPNQWNAEARRIISGMLSDNIVTGVES